MVGYHAQQKPLLSHSSLVQAQPSRFEDLLIQSRLMVRIWVYG